MDALDTETYQIEPGLLAPPLVCGSVASDTALAQAYLFAPADLLNWLRSVLASGNTIAGANIAYDFAVVAVADPTLLPMIFRAYEQGLIYDIQIAQTLDAIAGGHLGIDPRTGKGLVSFRTGRRSRYSLEACVDLVLGRRDAKVNNAWRLRYGELAELPISEWPKEARQYPLDDAKNTLEVALAQMKLRNLRDLPAQARAAFAMHLGAVWGLRTDQAAVASLESRIKAACEERSKLYREVGFFIYC